MAQGTLSRSQLRLELLLDEEILGHPKGSESLLEMLQSVESAPISGQLR